MAPDLFQEMKMPAYWTSQKHLPNDGGHLNTGRRLVVVVPDQDLDAVSFSRAIRSLAVPGFLDVLLVTIVHNEENELASRRRLATMATLVRDFDYEVETQVVWSRSWTGALRDLARADDVVLCPPEMNVRKGLRDHELLGEAINRQLGLTVRPMAGFFQKGRPGIKRFLLMIGYWAVILGILAGFFALESDVTKVATGWVSQIFLILLMAAEIGTIYLWTVISG
jgi:hypothetical protein